MKQKIYHIYARGQCIYHSLKEEEFSTTWIALNRLADLLADTSGKNKSAVKEWARYLVSADCVTSKPELGFTLLTGKFLDFVNKQINRL